MDTLLDYLAPVIFKGGESSDYVVEVLSNGGLGTRHMPSGAVVPHVLSTLPADSLQQKLPSQIPLDTGMQALNPYLQVANLGVGLLNLGVSAWTAWKVYKLDKKVNMLLDGLASIDEKVGRVEHLLGESVTYLDGLIRENARTLGLIVEHQDRIGRDLTALRLGVVQGFQSVHAALTSAEAIRRAQELEQQMRTLHRYYRTCSEEMKAGRQPPTTDLRRIVDVALELVAWAETRLAASRAGSADRLPLFITCAFALRIEVDARNQLDEAPGYARQEIDRLRHAIQDELRALTERAPLFALAEERGVLIEQYVYLQRATRQSATLIEFNNGRVVPYCPAAVLHWDDGLGGVRNAVAQRADAPAPALLELRTLEDHAAWQRLSGWPRGSADDEIATADLSRVLGLPHDRSLAAPDMLDLLRVAPAALADAHERISKELI